MIHTNIIAKVESFDEVKMLVDLAPLFMTDSGRRYERIVNARVLVQPFQLPNEIELKGGNISHSSLSEGTTSHAINSGKIEYSFNDKTEVVYVYPKYEKGDIVLVAIIERDYSDALLGKAGNGGSVAKHELTSAVILGKVAV